MTIEQLYELFLDTASRCSSSVLSASDEQIEYDLFEEFDIGVRSFFHDESLTRLAGAGLIKSEVVAACQEIRRRWLELEGTTWSVNKIKKHAAWRALFSLGDELLALLRK